ncbi:YkvA family protein [Frankia sp. AgKG'84/4]|uniref:YkvA family protein n=1 Tax=Frankia sp. AgKG'84/4 TaxID=573490 RepID=UPI00200E2748|nr:DUF1232 domain-containing protein [Frankia sp. AgKG'84/4]MCL9798339.1 DUF1232 domain-containing protein [Frankia sp. AgKG'84/4]
MGDVGITLLVAFGVLVAVGLALAVTALVVIKRYDLPVRGIAATLGSLAYVLSPVDAIPEVPLGPIGLIDDLMVVIAAVAYVRGLVNARRDLTPAGPGGRRGGR